MLIQVIGEMLPSSMAVTLSPFPIIAIVLLLGTPKAKANGLAFTAGWMVGLAALTAIVVFLVRESDDTESTSYILLEVFRIVAGSAMILLAAKKWKTRPRRGEEAVLPGWMSSIESSNPKRSLVLGLTLSAINPKNFALTASGTAFIAQAGLHGTDAIAPAIVFVMLSSVSVLAAVGTFLIGGERSKEPLDAVKQFMLDNNNVIMMIVLLVLGSKILGDGLAQLGR
jgi:threonine/homoserine/homoserine lactone efflux protein